MAKFSRSLMAVAVGGWLTHPALAVPTHPTTPQLQMRCDEGLRTYHPVHGKVISRDGQRLVVDWHHQAVTVILGEETHYYYGWLPGGSLAVQSGFHVEVLGRPLASGDFLAETVQVSLPWGKLLGGICLSCLGALAIWRKKAPPSPQTHVPGLHD